MDDAERTQDRGVAPLGACKAAWCRCGNAAREGLGRCKFPGISGCPRGRNVVVVDAPRFEDSGPFVAVGGIMRPARVPRRLHVDPKPDMMLEDFGNELLLRVVARTADADLETAYGRGGWPAVG